MIDTIIHQGQLLALILALILSHRFREPGIHFFTPDDLSQQLASMRHPVGKVIPPHVHHPVAREVTFTQDVLFIKPIAVGTPWCPGREGAIILDRSAFFW